MRQDSLSAREALAEKLRRLKPALAESVTAEFFQRHPDWLERYGERGRKLGIEDACFHVDFLAGAIESGSEAPFEDYARWTARVLAARNIAPRFVAENLEQVELALAGHLTGAEAEAVRHVLGAGRRACLLPAGESPAESPREGLALAGSLFLQAILKNQRRAALNVVLEALRDGHPPADVYVEVLQESLYQVGRQWEANRITVAEEHMATAITQYVMAQLYPNLPRAARERGRMVITGVARELHQVGANMVADVLDSQGYDVRFLGTNMPHPGIVRAVEEHRADVLGISTTMLFNIPQAVELIHEVRAQLGERSPRIVLGGAAFRGLPALAEELSTAGYAGDIRAALHLLC